MEQTGIDKLIGIPVAVVLVAAVIALTYYLALDLKEVIYVVIAVLLAGAAGAIIFAFRSNIEKLRNRSKDAESAGVSKTKEQPVSSKSLVLKTSERETEDSNLDPALYHLTGVLFYPKDTPRNDRVPSKSLPRRGIINWSTKKVYYMNKDADDLLIERRINWTTRDWISEDDFAEFFKKEGFELIRRPANTEDLQKKPVKDIQSPYDPSLDHLQGFVFWEWYYWYPQFRPLRKKNPQRLPGKKYVANLSTKKAYLVDSYVYGLIANVKIKSTWERRPVVYPNEKLKAHAASLGFTLEMRPTADSELARA